MTLNFGEEFKAKARPSAELQRKLLYLAAKDHGSINTGGVKRGDPASKQIVDQEDADFDVMMWWAELTIATQQRIAQIQQRLDLLDEASLKALREAEERLDELRRAANRARDGRRVYETKDGSKVLDENGREVKRDEIDPQGWDPDATKWEEYDRAVQDERNIRRWRDKLDERRKRLEKNPSDRELDDLERELDELEADMPDSVRRHYDAHDAKSPEHSAQARAGGTSFANGADKSSFASAPKVARSFDTAHAGTAQPSDAPGQTQRPVPGQDFTS